ncbi:molecular chaperone TorD family protein [Haloarculaceae archaeon H-GB11]|nr:molecular chaperone TorD family protein [Haloarculaceae archaeon H-GB11]
MVYALKSGALADIIGPSDGADLRDLRTEYTRLFIGPAGPPCPPYESVFRDGDGDELGPVRGPATAAVARWYRSFGIELAGDNADLPDHIATELEFAAYLATEGHDDRLEQFLDEHLRVWSEQLTARVEAETTSTFYASLASTTRELIET